MDKVFGSTRVLGQLIVALAFTASAGPVWAQNGATATPESVLTPGMTAWLTDATGREQKTRIVSVSGDLVTASVDESIRELRTGDITRVRVRRNDSLLNGALIGAGAAIGTGLIMCNLTEPWQNCRDDVGPMVRIGAFGAGIGLAVDAFIRFRQTIYEDPARRGLNASPIVAPGVAGARISFSF